MALPKSGVHPCQPSSQKGTFFFFYPLFPVAVALRTCNYGLGVLFFYYHFSTFSWFHSSSSVAMSPRQCTQELSLCTKNSLCTKSSFVVDFKKPLFCVPRALCRAGALKHPLSCVPRTLCRAGALKQPLSCVPRTLCRAGALKQPLFCVPRALCRAGALKHWGGRLNRSPPFGRRPPHKTPFLGCNFTFGELLRPEKGGKELHCPLFLIRWLS